MKLRIAIITSVIIAGLGSWLLLYSSSAAPVSTEVKLYLNPSQQTTKQGQTFSEAIRLSKIGNEKVDYVSAQLTFPAQLVEVKSVSRTGSAFNTGAGLRVTYSNSKGTLTAAGSGNALANPADVLVVTVTFVAKTGGQASLKFSPASHAGALLGNNTVKNALDTMVGSGVVIAATTQPSTPSGGGSASTRPPTRGTGGITLNEPAITTPDAPPSSTSTLNDAPQSKDTVVVPTNNVGVAAKHANTNQMQPWIVWVLVAGLLAIILGGVVVWLSWYAKNHLPQPGVAESDSEIVSPQSEDTASDIENDTEVPSAVDLSAADVIPEGESGAPEQMTTEPQPTPSQPTVPLQSEAIATPVPAETAATSSSASAVAEAMSVPVPQTQTNVSAPTTVNPPRVSERHPAQPVNLKDSDAVPDMFDAGEKRLKSEGL